MILGAGGAWLIYTKKMEEGSEADRLAALAPAEGKVYSSVLLSGLPSDWFQAGEDGIREATKVSCSPLPVTRHARLWSLPLTL